MPKLRILHFPTSQAPYYSAKEYWSTDCSGASTREWTLLSIATSAGAADQTCVSPDGPTGTWSVRGQWCDFSGAQPKLQGTLFSDSNDCSTTGSGYGPDGNGIIADGTTCFDHGNGYTSGAYLCVADGPPAPPAPPLDLCSANTYAAGLSPDEI